MSVSLECFSLCVCAVWLLPSHGCVEVKDLQAPGRVLTSHLTSTTTEPHSFTLSRLIHIKPHVPFPSLPSLVVLPYHAVDGGDDCIGCRLEVLRDEGEGQPPHLSPREELRYSVEEAAGSGTVSLQLGHILVASSKRGAKRDDTATRGEPGLDIQMDV